MPASPLPAPWSERLATRAERLRSQGRFRQIHPPSGVDFCSNDYLGLRKDPRLAEAAAAAAEAWGTGAGAARLLRGTSPVHEDLESALAAWKGLPACLLFNTGYQANLSVPAALLEPGDALFSDRLNHASLVDGCRLARLKGAEVHIFNHLDTGDLERRLAKWQATAPVHARALVVTDALFSMDGDAADLPVLVDICDRFEALLMVDEAHATGILGTTGAGLCEHQGVKGRVPLVMGTMGKALGSVGAFIACPEVLRDHLVNTSRGFIFSTALPAPVAAAALEGVRVAQTEPWRREQALAYAKQVREALELPLHPSVIIPVVIGRDEDALEAAERLQDQGFDVRAVRPPTVPEGTARLRITTGAHLTSTQVGSLCAALRALWS